MKDLSLKIVITAVIDQLQRALNAVRGGLGEAEAGTRSWQDRLNNAVRSTLDFGSAIKSLIAGFSLLALAASVKELVAWADSLRLVEGRIRNASTGAADFARNYAALVAVSIRTGTEFAANAEMFSRVAASIRAIGGESRDALRQVDLLAKGLKLSGAGNAESSATIRQYAQAMGSGVLRGDEFSSIVEQAPRVAKAISDSLGVSIGALRAMAEAGELTATKVAQALASQGKAIDAEFARLPVTVGQAFEKIKTAFGQYLADADRAGGATAGIAAGMEGLALHLGAVLDALVAVAKVAAIMFTGSAIAGLGGYVAGKVRLAAAAREAAAAEAALLDAARVSAAQSAQSAASDLAAAQALSAKRAAQLAAAEAALAEAAAIANTVKAQEAAVVAARQRLASAVTVQAVVAAENELTAAIAAQAETAWTAAAAERNLSLAQAEHARLTAAATEAAAARTIAEQQLTAAMAAQSEAQAAISATSVAASTGIAALLSPMNLLNVAMAAFVGYAIGQWLNSFTTVRRGAVIAIDAIESGVAGLGHGLVKLALQAQSALTFDTAGVERLQKRIAELDAEYARQSEARARARAELLSEVDATGKAATATDDLADSFKNAKSPQQIFEQQQRDLKKALDEGRISAETYANAVVKLREAMLNAVEAQKSLFQKEKDALQDKQDKATLAPEAYQRKQYEKKGYDAGQIDELMAIWRETEQFQAGHKTAGKDAQSLARETLAFQLQQIQTRQQAVRAAAADEIATLQAGMEEQRNELERQVQAETLTREGQKAKLLELEKEFADAKLRIQRDEIERSAALERAAAEARIAALKAEAVAAPSRSSLAGLIAGGESGGDYNAYNKGTAGGKIIPATGPVALESMTVAEIQARQALDIGNADRLGAVGKYQMVASTLKGAVDALKLSADAKFDAATQERIFAEYLAGSKRPGIKNYITGKSDNLSAAQLSMAMEWRAVPDPSTGQSYGGNRNGNRPQMTTPQVQAGLQAARAGYPQGIAAGLDPDTAYRQAITGDSATLEERQAFAVKLATLNAQLEQVEADKTQKLKALGIEERSATAEQAGQALALEKDKLAEKRALAGEEAQARRDAAMDGLAAQEAASQLDLDLGNITQAEHFDNLREFAAERLRIEEELLNDKRKLLADDKLALAQNLHAKEALEREYAGIQRGIDTQEARERRATFKSWMQPFESAIDSMVNGVLSGQQSIGKAVRNAGANMLISYAATIAKKRAMDVADWAFEIMGFGAKETAKAGLKVAGEAAQTGAQVAGDQARVASAGAAAAEKKAIESTAAKESIIKKAASAAAGAYEAMAQIPIVGPFLGGIAAAATFMAVMAFGTLFSARGGDWEVQKDGQPYILHEKEMVLPAWAAQGLRQRILGGGPEAHIAEINAAFASGKLPRALALPAFAMEMPAQAQAAAGGIVRAGAARQDVGGGDPGRARRGKADGETHFHFHGAVVGEREFFKRNSQHLRSTLQDGVRSFQKVKRQ